MPGYKLEVKGEYARIESLLCPYCDLILKEAIQTEQGYRLCLSCYDEIQKNPNVLQKFEDLELEPNEPYHPDKAVRREVDKIPVLCENHKLGCGWSGKLGAHEKDHKQVCQYKSEDCPNQCGQRLLVDKLDNHLKKECPLRKIQCQYCKAVVIAKDYKNHLQTCPLAPFKCDSCGQEVPQTQKDSHLILDCKQALLCVGCNHQKATICKTATHLKDNKEVFQHLQQLGLAIKISEKQNALAIENAPQKITAGLSSSEELQSFRKEVKAMMEELEVKLHNESSKKFDELFRKIKELKSTVKTSQSHPSAQGFKSTAYYNFPADIQGDQFKGKVVETNQLDYDFAPVSSLITKLVITRNGYPSPIQHIPKKITGIAGNCEAHPSSKQSAKSSLCDSADKVGLLERKVAETNRQLAVMKVNTSELELQLQASLASTYNGSFLWRIPDIKRRRQDALEGKITSIYSPPFYTGRNGYKMCVRAYLNGDGIGYNTHLSIFFVLMKGDYDPLLKWPFDYKVSLILVDQDHRRHIVQTFKPSPSSSSFQKPKSDMNISSGCPKLASLQVLDNKSYVKEDVMYIKCIVQPSIFFNSTEFYEQ